MSSLETSRVRNSACTSCQTFSRSISSGLHLQSSCALLIVSLTRENHPMMFTVSVPICSVVLRVSGRKILSGVRMGPERPLEGFVVFGPRFRRGIETSEGCGRRTRRRVETFSGGRNSGLREGGSRFGRGFRTQERVLKLSFLRPTDASWCFFFCLWFVFCDLFLLWRFVIVMFLVICFYCDFVFLLVVFVMSAVMLFRSIVRQSCHDNSTKRRFCGRSLHGRWCPSDRLKNRWGKLCLSLRINFLNRSAAEVLGDAWIILWHVMTWRSSNYVFDMIDRKQDAKTSIGTSSKWFYILDIGHVFTSRSGNYLIAEFLFRIVSNLMRLINDRTYYHWRMEEVQNISKWYDVNSDPFENVLYVSSSRFKHVRREKRTSLIDAFTFDRPQIILT